MSPEIPGSNFWTLGLKALCKDEPDLVSPVHVKSEPLFQRKQKDHAQQRDVVTT
jgi:hypothetical protein